VTRPFARAAAVVLWTGVAVAFLPSIWLAVAASALLTVGIWKFGGCHHPRPLALLPPVHGPGDEHLPARWFCSRCGRTWTAAMERLQAPVQRFAGYDATKAPQAARRAAALEQRMRELAVQRGGMKKPAAPVARRVAPPVPIHTRRAAG
jgi:hypothetical protein